MTDQEPSRAIVVFIGVDSVDGDLIWERSDTKEICFTAAEDAFSVTRNWLDETWCTREHYEKTFHPIVSASLQWFLTGEQ